MKFQSELKSGFSAIWAPIAVISLTALILAGTSMGLSEIAAVNAQTELHNTMLKLLPGSTSFEQEIYDEEDTVIQTVYKAENGYVIQTSTHGYAGEIVVLTGVDLNGAVTGLVVRNLSETCGLGAEVLTDTEFLSQFLNTSGEAEIGNTVDAISGATVTSKAVAKGVNAAAAYVTGADITSGATTWGE